MFTCVDISPNERRNEGTENGCVGYVYYRIQVSFICVGDEKAVWVSACIIRYMYLDFELMNVDGRV